MSARLNQFISEGNECDSVVAVDRWQARVLAYLDASQLEKEAAEDRPYVKIMVGETEAQIFDLNDKKRVWYVVQKSRGLIVQGSFASGEQVQF